MPRGTDRYDEARLQGRLWTPDLFQPNLTLWLDAQDFGTITVATGVSSWRDKSGKGNTVTQGSSGGQPPWSPTGLRGLPCLSFNGANYFMTKTSFPSAVNWSCFAVTIPNAVASTQLIVDTDSSPRSAQNLRTLSSTVQSIAFNTGGTPFTDGGASISNGTPYVFSSIRRSANVEVFSNGVSGGATATTGTGQSGAVTLTIGANNAGAFSIYNGLIGEVHYYSVDLSAREQSIVEGYLAWKWFGSANGLTATHPFKNRPPLIGD